MKFLNLNETEGLTLYGGCLELYTMKSINMKQMKYLHLKDIPIANIHELITNLPWLTTLRIENVDKFDETHFSEVHS